MSRGNMLEVRGVTPETIWKRAIFKGKLLTGGKSASVILPMRIYLILQKKKKKKKRLKNSTVNLILLFKYCRYFHSSNICERPLFDTTCFDLSEKCRIKWVIFVFLIFQIVTLYLIGSYFIFASKKDFSVFNPWYSSVVYYDGEMTAINYKQKKGCWKFSVREQRKISLFLFLFSFSLLPIVM